MGTSDGGVLGLTTVLNNGPNNQRFNIVLVAEGFQNTTADQNAFNQRCQDVVDAFQDEPWFGAGLLGSINIHRLNVWSTDQGADSPATCADGSTGSGAAPATFFDASYCSSGIQRCLAADWTLVRNTITASLPIWHAAAVIVNSTMRGGCASGNVFATALSADFLNVVMHELGHAAFDLGDEYSTWQGCASGETDRDNAPPDEPDEPNITAANTLGGLKWADLVLPTTPVPTMENPDCTQCDLRPNVRPDDTEIGLFEGAGYYHCGYYRPAYVCKMRDSSKHFCRVCARAILDKLDTFFGATPGLAASATELDFGNVGVNASLTVGLDVVERRDRPGHGHQRRRERDRVRGHTGQRSGPSHRVPSRRSTSRSARSRRPGSGPGYSRSRARRRPSQSTCGRTPARPSRRCPCVPPTGAARSRSATSHAS